MKQKIAHARHDELHRLKGGKAGDQTGGEVAITDWYLHTKGWKVFRCKDKKKRLLIAECAEKIAKNSHFGYDQSQRNNGWDAFKTAEFDPDKVKINVETDCSGMVRMCIAHAYSKDLVGNIRTDSMINILPSTGEFELIADKDVCCKPDKLRRGDILVTPVKGHTVIVLKDGGLSHELDKPSKFDYDYAGGYTVNTRNGLNLRVGAGTNKKIITTIPYGEYITSNGFYATYNNNVWLLIAYENDDKELFMGYCAMKYLV